MKIFKNHKIKNPILAGSTFIIASSISISAIAGPKTHSVRIFENPAPEVETRIPQVQRFLPPAPVSQPRDRGAVVWVTRQNGQVRPLASGGYSKINNTASIQWRETRFGRAGGQHANNCNRPNGACSVSPLLLDLSRDGINLGEKGVSVNFDLQANGVLENYQWVSVNTDDGFLALDINGNGIIDDGRELFGEGTLIHATGERALDGYTALQQYDLPELGGNQDGKINRKDSIWNNLVLWVDRDADGFSTTQEIHSLTDFKIRKINVIPRLTKKTNLRFDSAGNEIPYWSWLTTNDSELPKKLKMVDVFFKVVD